MSINLGCCNGRMSKEFLDSSDISAVREESRRETMSECVSRDLFYDICSKCIFLDLIGDEKPRESHICINQRLFYNIISMY